MNSHHMGRSVTFPDLTVGAHRSHECVVSGDAMTEYPQIFSINPLSKRADWVPGAAGPTAATNASAGR